MTKRKQGPEYGLLLILLACFLLSGCEAPGEAAAVSSDAGEMTAVTTEHSETESETAPAPADSEGSLFLTVSEITFSVVGEQENIYVGTVPVEEVSFHSEDETIIWAENGVLTAVGVGSTTVTASWKDQQVSCQAGCLAKDHQELLTLETGVLNAPKRIAPITEDSVLSYFKNAAMVGDSITYGFMKYEAQNGRLGGPRCLCRGKLGINNLLTHNLDLYYQGAEMPLEEVLADAAPEKVFILLGTNDVMVRPKEDVISELDQLLTLVLQKSPDLQIYLQSVFPVASSDEGAEYNNQRIEAYNKDLQAYAEKKGFHYVSIAPYLQDHLGGFSSHYHQDTFHPSYDGVCAWIDTLRAYACLQQLKGE